MFTARYGLSPYIKQIGFVFKGLRCPASKNHTGSGLVSKEATVPSILFCQHKHSVNNAFNLIKNHVTVMSE
jgi:hypothetical protein